MKRTPLKRKSPLARRRKRPESTPPAWRVVPGELCICGVQASDGHHVIPKHTLRAYGHEALLFDLRNRLALCRDCHANHHAASARIGRDQLRPANVEFAMHVRLLWLLARTYPERTADV